jgi:hypothetical protein
VRLKRSASRQIPGGKPAGRNLERHPLRNPGKRCSRTDGELSADNPVEYLHPLAEPCLSLFSGSSVSMIFAGAQRFSQLAERISFTELFVFRSLACHIIPLRLVFKGRSRTSPFPVSAECSAAKLAWIAQSSQLASGPPLIKLLE